LKEAPLHQQPAAHSDLETHQSFIDTSIGIPELDVFFDRGVITGIHAQLTSGKEATVYCCRAHPSTNRRFIAAKIYREHAARSIRRGLYFEGRERGMKARELRAITNASGFGHQMMAGMWMHAEHEFLQQLFAAGADVPKPHAMCGRVILMDYIGNGDGPAPHLNGVDLDKDMAHRYFGDVLNNIEIMLSENLVHGDLSPYNILVWKDKPWIIDMPQAVDVRFNRNAFELLRRDLENICEFFEQHGVKNQSTELAINLWDRYQRATL
jgi:RIO kinase 1